jgi:ribosomal protein S27E
MAYLTCPDCMMPNVVADDAIHYWCFSCSAEIIFEACKECGHQQAIPARWQVAFSCGLCNSKVDIPRQRFYSTSAKAAKVKGYGYVYPKL